LPLVRTTAVVLALAAGALGGCRAGGPPDPVIVQLGEQVVRRSAFDRHVSDLEARGGARFEPEVRQALFRPFVEERLLAMEARARGLMADGAAEDGERKAVEQLLREEVLTRVSVPDAEVAAYCDAHPDEFAVPERVVLRQILVGSANEARDVRRRLSRDPKAFDLLARTRSRGPEAGQGGRMGTFARGELPAELEGPAFALAAGETSDVVASPLGHHVLRVEERQPARAAHPEECRKAVREKLLARKSEQGVRDFVRGLWSRARVNQDAVRVTTPS
jgi:parvulin-like peptidyl-prolyl isomerase